MISTIDDLHLSPPLTTNNSKATTHDVPTVFFSTGGYTRNVYHEFKDDLIPLYITSHQYNKRVIFEFHDWWISKYSDIHSHLSNYPAVDFLL
ncbi:unnamed protein product [Linum trigynum]|uniref:Uncharacterized protein n=1 Tax=Linum trigynum TaxID=586398 RepID=A0AAV2CHD0_9ROSI